MAKAKLKNPKIEKPTILITNDEGVFALTGRIIEFPFLDNKLSLPVDSIFEETLEDEEMDFGML